MRRVLVVDDEDDVREIVAAAFTHLAGCDVATACSGTDALDALARERFDVVVLDVCMPGLDGPAVLAALRSRADATPVVFLTAHPDIPRFRALDCRGVVRKPFDVVDLPATVAALVHQN